MGVSENVWKGKRRGLKTRKEKGVKEKDQTDPGQNKRRGTLTAPTRL